MSKTKVITIRLENRTSEIMQKILEDLNKKYYISQTFFLKRAIEDFCKRILEQGSNLIDSALLKRSQL